MDRNYLLSMIKELVSIPSVTESASESLPGEAIFARLSKLAYFREHPGHLQLADTPLEGSPHRLRSLVARVDAAKKTCRTVLMIGHYDVVGIECYGDIAEHAFSVDELGKIFNAGADTIYGRGVMDMKCGDAVETALIEEFAEDRGLFDVNLVMALVGDEENSSAGMRGVLPLLSAMKREGLDFLAAIDTEPGEAGQSGAVGPMVFLGTLGKIMPAFYVKGRGAHVGNCYDGFSALLAASCLVSSAEGDPALADPVRGVCQPSWICLDMKAMHSTYSVTVPDKAYAYFNCFTTKNTPAQIIVQMRNIARGALEKAASQTEASYRALLTMGYSGSAFTGQAPSVYTFGELCALARSRFGEEFDSELRAFSAALPPGDMRERGIKIVDFAAERSGAEAPYIVVFFLPPWLPVRSDLTESGRDAAVVRAVRETEAECAGKYGLEMKEIEFFAGLCDLSYAGGNFSSADAAAFSENMPGWGEIYSIPLRDMQELGMPVVNLGPSGEAPHRKEERLYLSYSLDVFPELLKSLIAKISANCL